MKSEPRPATTGVDSIVHDPDNRSGCSPESADHAASKSLRQGEAVALFVDVLGFRSLCERAGTDPSKPLSVIESLESLRGSWWVSGFDLHSYRVSDSVVFVLFSNKTHELADCAEELIYVARLQVIQKLLDNGLLVQGGVDVGYAYSDQRRNVCFGSAVSGAYAVATRSPVLPRISISADTSVKLRLGGRVKNVGTFLNDPTPMVDYLGILDQRRFHLGDTALDSYMGLLEKHKAAVMDYINNASDPASVSKCTWLLLYHNSAVEGVLDAEFCGPAARDEGVESGWASRVKSQAQSLLIRASDVDRVLRIRESAGKTGEN